MKRSILIISAVSLSISLMAFGYLKRENTPTQCSQEPTLIKPAPIDFVYDIDSRFLSTVTKEKIHNAKSLFDFLPKSQTDQVAEYDFVKVIILDDYHQTDLTATGKDENLNAAQQKLLQTVDYSTNILIRAEFLQKNAVTGELGYNYFTPHITIVPEKEAEYINGINALVDFLKGNSKKETKGVKKNKLKDGKIYFTVSKDGTITNPDLASTSGYPAIDKKMMELLTKVPGKWMPAENSKGEKVEQKLVFSFGIMGC